jgi:hypothetical protein
VNVSVIRIGDAGGCGHVPFLIACNAWFKDQMPDAEVAVGMTGFFVMKFPG